MFGTRFALAQRMGQTSATDMPLLPVKMWCGLILTWACYFADGWNVYELLNRVYGYQSNSNDLCTEFRLSRFVILL